MISRCDVDVRLFSLLKIELILFLAMVAEILTIIPFSCFFLVFFYSHFFMLFRPSFVLRSWFSILTPILRVRGINLATWSWLWYFWPRHSHMSPPPPPPPIEFRFWAAHTLFPSDIIPLFRRSMQFIFDAVCSLFSTQYAAFSRPSMQFILGAVGSVFWFCGSQNKKRVTHMRENS